jgi:hypothetical protein
VRTSTTSGSAILATGPHLMTSSTAPGWCCGAGSELSGEYGSWRDDRICFADGQWRIVLLPRWRNGRQAGPVGSRDSTSESSEKCDLTSPLRSCKFGMLPQNQAARPEVGARPYLENSTACYMSMPID